MKKWLAVLLVVAMMLSMLPMIALAQSTDKTLYLKPNANWTSGGARFAAYFFGNGETWVSMTDSDSDGIYEVTAPAGYPNVIFCRMNPGAAANDWGNKWNQTNDLVIPTDENNLYTVAENTWDNGGGTWSVKGQAITYPDRYVTGTLAGGWGANEVKMTHNGNGSYTADISVAQAGTYEMKVTDGTWDEGKNWGLGGNNYPVIVSAAGTVTVTYNYAGDAIAVSGANVVPFIIVAGNGKTGWLNEKSWDTKATANMMTYNGDGKYSIVFENVPQGTGYQFKFTGNGDWGGAYELTGTFANFGDEIALSGGPNNIEFALAETAEKVEILLDLNAAGGPKATVNIPVEYTVTFNPNQGTVNPTSAETEGGKLTSLPTPTRTGYTFNGWFTAATGGEQVTANTEFTANTEIFAQWTLTEYTVTLDANSGTLAGGVTSLSTQNNKLTALPSDPTREGYKFLGWFTAADNQVTLETTFSADATITAKWEKLPVVTFDAAEGTVTPESASVGADGKLTSLPTPTRDGYTFDGWYKGQTKAELTDVYTADTTLTAKWTQNAPAPQGVTYVVAGSEALLGHNWKADGTVNVMTKKADGSYELKLTNVAAANDYQLKVVGLETGKDAAWYGDATGQNVTFNVTAKSDVTVTFNPTTKEIKVTGEKVAFASELNVSYWAAVGNGSGNWLNGASWKPAETANKMTANGKVYTITFKNVAKGNLEVKFAADGDWAHNFGNNGSATLAADKLGKAIDAKYNGDNFKFANPYDKADITLTLDLTGFNFADKSGAKVTIALTEVTTGGGDTTGGDSTTGGDDTTGGSDADDTVPGDTTPEKITEITVYAKVPDNWDGPGVWAWNDKQENAFEAWPGLAMTKGENGWWYAKVPAWVENVIINAHGGAWQTADLDLEKLEMDVWVEVTVDEAGQASTKITYSNPKTGEGDAIFAVAAALLLASTALVTTVASKKKFF